MYIRLPTGGPMSARNGDKSRYGRQRRKKIAQRARTRALRRLLKK